MARASRQRCRSDCSSRFSAPKRKAPAWDCPSQPGSSTNMAVHWSSGPRPGEARSSMFSCQWTAMEDEPVAQILIIDDDQSVPMALQAALGQVGHKVEIATDAEKGVTLVGQGEFDVVLLDLHWEGDG